MSTIWNRRRSEWADNPFFLIWSAWTMIVVILNFTFIVFTFAVLLGEWIWDRLSNADEVHQVSRLLAELVEPLFDTVWADVWFVFCAAPLLAGVGVGVPLLAFFAIIWVFDFLVRRGKQLFGLARKKLLPPKPAETV